MADEEYRERLLSVLAKNKDVIAGDDGYYIFWPTRVNSGALTANDLRIIADHLDLVNAPWDAQMKEYFDSVPNPDGEPLGL